MSSNREVHELYHVKEQEVEKGKSSCMIFNENLVIFSSNMDLNKLQTTIARRTVDSTEKFGNLKLTKITRNKIETSQKVMQILKIG